MYPLTKTLVCGSFCAPAIGDISPPRKNIAGGASGKRYDRLGS